MNKYWFILLPSFIAAFSSSIANAVAYFAGDEVTISTT
jgi:hypothetical protein